MDRAPFFCSHVGAMIHQTQQQTLLGSRLSRRSPSHTVGAASPVDLDRFATSTDLRFGVPRWGLCSFRSALLGLHRYKPLAQRQFGLAA